MIHRKLFGGLAVALALSAATQIPASASTGASASSLANDLLPSAYASKIGFPTVVDKVTTSDTGKKACPLDADEAFESAKGKLALISGAALCTTSQGAAMILKSARSSTSATSASPPKQLGSSAIERSSGGSVYEIYWLRGRTLEVVKIYAVIGSRHRRPITSAQQKILSSAAVEQNGLVARITT